MTEASGAATALRAAGAAVNDLDLRTEAAIRRAIPIATAGATRAKGRTERTGQYGRYTGLRIAKAQNWLYEQNRIWQFSDGTLCVLWCVEFPDAKSDYAAKLHYIASTRTAYNAGRHQAPAPAVSCVGYPRGEAAQSATSGQPLSQQLKPEMPLPSAAEATRTEPIRHTPVRLSFSSDLKAGAARRRALEAYLRTSVLGPTGFICRHYSTCKDSHPGDFFEGQLHHVGAHYDLRANGRPLRIVVVGQEVGNGPGRVPMAKRTHAVLVTTGREHRFFTEAGLPARNPHMRGTTSLLRLLIGRQPGRDYGGEFIQVSGQPVHLFDAFALTNFLLCSAIAAEQIAIGSKRGRSTRTMQQRCGEHFAAAIRILQPSVVINQGKGVRKWMDPLVERSRQITPELEAIRMEGHEFLLASFTHPSVPSVDNWGTDECRPYLLTVVAPTVRHVHRELGLAELIEDGASQ